MASANAAYCPQSQITGHSLIVRLVEIGLKARAK